MKKIIVVIFIILFHSAKAQVENDISIFHRILILNSKNELMVVKIENTDFWVTPGLYQTKEQTIKNGLDSLSSTYGFDIKELKLKGTFILKRELNGKHSTSLRHVYTAKIKDGVEKRPNEIEEIKWLSTNKAIEKITFPHINEMIKQIMAKPDEIWGGTLLQFKEGNKWKTKILEEFYTL
ncbi:hypothetical protein LVD15_01865 [Fulvivirga maritima]|uniref:hypothetical protein n=1 Tax=Fulvivirga maritima TaxID=2904247 RepID=UPI001F1ACCDD|nr:hypothetical protein [Fulvivirga maritima]UII27196.1 hypothetical protein LVD15_01865 [Fulvivirga maritima]